MLWPHTKTLVPAEAGYEIFVEMWKPPFAKHIVLTWNSMPRIVHISSSSIRRPKGLHTPESQ